ncbi:MAG TPA: BON domain-containing protein [Candidatus Binatia bacterium]
MKDTVLFLTGAAFGAGMMYALDPDAGRRRRALTRDQLVRARIKTRETASATARDLLNRSYGVMAGARSRLFQGEVDDQVIEQRVRSKFGYVVRNPAAIEARVDSGRVSLIGAVRADEVDQLIAEVSAVSGVRAVENHLDVHRNADHVPELQGGDKPKPSPRRLDIYHRRWSPATRLLIGISGAAIVYAVARPHFLWSALLSLGLVGYASAGADAGRALLPRRTKGKQLNALYDPLSTGWSS